jgi:hypothetical protein
MFYASFVGMFLFFYHTSLTCLYPPLKPNYNSVAHLGTHIEFHCTNWNAEVMSVFSACTVYGAGLGYTLALSLLEDSS